MKKLNTKKLRTYSLIALLFCSMFIVLIGIAPSVSATGGITRVQGNARGIVPSGGTVINVTLTSSPTVGNFLIATTGANPAGSQEYVVSVSQTGVSWYRAIAKNDTTAGMASEIWYGNVTSSTNSKFVIITFAYAVNQQNGVADVCEYSGLASNPLYVTNSTTTASTVTNTSISPTTSQNDESLIGGIASMSSGAQTTPTNSFVLLDGALSDQFSEAYLERNVTATGKYNSGTTVNNSNVYDGCIATFKEAGASDTSSPTYSSPSTSTTMVGANCNFGVSLADETALANYTFGCNVTGSWVNDSVVTIPGTPTSYLANTTHAWVQTFVQTFLSLPNIFPN